MSLYQFFASEKEMPEFDNMNPTVINVNGEHCVISCHSNFEKFVPMRILKEDDLSYAYSFTDKRFVNFFEGECSDTNAKVIIDYIKIVLKDRFCISLFNTWMEDKSELVTRKICINDLTIEEIKGIWGQRLFKQNECLIVFRSY